jgi:tRNA1Val (adenine37-N6)-methyltransferase
MKVGTDSVILGTWVNVEDARNILDVGTGCGVLALMMAQRSQATIHAVELDKDSALEAGENFLASQWHNRMHVFHDDFMSYARQTSQKYDLIISNPPFFNSAFKGSDVRRSLARHIDTLPFDQMISSSANILNTEAKLAVVLPVGESETFVKIARTFGLYPKRLLEIVPVEGRPANRLNIELAFENCSKPLTETFTIRQHDGEFTAQYRRMLGEYYLGL